MPKYHVTTPTGTYEIDSPTELSDAEVYQHAQSQGAGESAASRGLSGFLSTSPLNPMNIVRAVAHPVDTLTGMVADPLANLLKVGGDLKDVVTGGDNGRLIAGVNAVKHLGGSVPLIGPAAINAGNKIGEGDIAGGAGELAGIASGALLPKIAAKAPAALGTIGEGLERVGAKAQKPLSLASLVEVGKNPVAAAGMYTAPYALEYAGKGAKALGKGLDSLKERMTPAEDETPAPRGPRRSTEIPYRRQGELPNEAPAKIDWSQYMTKPEPVSPPLTPMQQFYRDNPMGEGRLTGLGEGARAAGKGNLYDIGPRAAEPGVSEFPEFTFEGEPADFGDYPAGPTIDMPPSLRSLHPSPEAPLADPAAELARRLGTPSTDQMLESLVRRNTTGSWNPR